MTKGNNVRITEEAHRVLVEQSEEHDISMKEIASDAVISLFKRRQRERNLLEDIARLEKKLQDSKWYALGAFILGAVAAACVMFFVGGVI